MRGLLKAYFWFWVTKIYVPLLMIFIFSLNSYRYMNTWQGFSTIWYHDFFNSSTESDFVANSIRITLLTLLITVPIGVAAALCLNRIPRVLKGTLLYVTYIQAIMPEIIMGIGLASLFSVLQVRLGFTTLLIAHVTFSVSFFLLSFNSLISSDLWNFTKVAADLGASRLLTVRKVLLPLILSPIIASAFLVASLSLDNYIVSLFTSGAGLATFPVFLFSSIRQGLSPVANVGAVILMLVGLLCAVLAFKFTLNSPKNENAKT